MTTDTRRQTALVALLAFVSLVGYALRSNVTIAQERMAPELGLTMADMGTITAWGFQLAYAVFQLPAGILADRFGPRLILGVSILGWAATSFASGLVGATAGAFATLFAARLLLGVTQAATYPVSALVVSQAIPADRRTTANAIVISAALLGSAVAPFTLAPLMAATGWRNVFLASGVVGLITAVLWLALAPLPAAGARAFRSLREEVVTGLRLLGDRDLLILSTAYLLHSAVFFVFIFWFFRYLTDGRGFDLLASGVWGSVPPLVAFLLAPIGGLIPDRLGHRLGLGRARRRTAMAALVLAAVLVLLGVNLANPYLGIAALALSIGCINSAEGPFWSTATSLVPANPGAAGGVLNLMGNLGGVISIWAVPRMRDPLGWTGLFAVWAGVAVVAALLWLAVRVDRPRPA